MSYSEPLQMQLQHVLAFLGVGFLLGLFYLACTVVRRLFGNGRRATVLLDLLFSFGVFTALFCTFLSETNGVWRLPELLSCGAGFLAFQLSAARLLRPPLLAGAAFFNRGVNRCYARVEQKGRVLHTRLCKLMQTLSARCGRCRRRRSSDSPNAGKKNRSKQEKNTKKLLQNEK